MGDRPRQPVDYATGEARRRSSHIWLKAAAIVFTAMVAITEWALFELQRMPYRPPFDNSTLLGAGEIEAVRGLMGVVAGVWGLVMVALGIAWLRWRSGKRERGRD